MMNPQPSSTIMLKAGGAIAFGITAVIGWNLGVSAPASSPQGGSIVDDSRAARRMALSSHFPAADIAAKRMAAIKGAGGATAKQRATVALAYSISPTDFADWIDRGWFNVRGGAELTLFTKIIEDRWQTEDPEGYFQWSLKRPGGQSSQLIASVAETDPQKLIDFFNANPGNPRESAALEQIAKHHPEIALQRLMEVLPTQDPNRGSGIYTSVLQQIADQSPAALEAAMASLPPSLKKDAEASLVRNRLKASFDGEIENLWARADGWEVFQRSVNSMNDFGGKIVDRLADLPPEWRGGISSNPYNFVRDDNAGKWLDADLEGLGFAPGSAKVIQSQALAVMARKNPEEAFKMLETLEMGKRERRNVISSMFSYGQNQEKAAALIASFQNEEEKQYAQTLLDSRNPTARPNMEQPKDLLDAITKPGANKSEPYRFIQLLQSWDQSKINDFQAQFKTLAPEQKQQAAMVLASGSMRMGDNSPLVADSIRYLVENPPPKPAEPANGGYDPFSNNSDPVRLSANYVVKMATDNPEGAATWVKTLPSGEAKNWAQKNLYSNWKQYDPVAADQWEKSLPASDRAAMKKLGNR